MSVRWGVIGAGGIARRRTIPEGIIAAANAELAAVMDVAPGVAKEVAEEFNAPNYYEDIDDILSDKNVDAVYIAVPVFLHEKIFTDALNAGKHVLIEKPLAFDVATAEKMVGLVKKSGLKATEGYMMKFHPMHQYARKAIAGGKLGKVVSMRGQLSCWFPPMENNWRQIPEKGGGGAIMDMATHVYDLMQFLIGERVFSVAAFVDNLVHDYKAEDSAVTILRFTGGCQGVVESYFNVRDECVPRRLEIYGSAGSFLSDGTIGQGGGEMRELFLEEGAGYDADQQREAEAAAYRPVELPETNMYQSEIEYLGDCIINDHQPGLNSIEDGVHVLKIAAAAYESARTGRTVEL